MNSIAPLSPQFKIDENYNVADQILERVNVESNYHWARQDTQQTLPKVIEAEPKHYSIINLLLQFKP